MAGRAKENLPGGSLKYLFVYLKVRIFKCSCPYCKQMQILEIIEFVLERWCPIITVMTFKYVEGGPERKAPEVVWNTSSYI